MMKIELRMMLAKCKSEVAELTMSFYYEKGGLVQGYAAMFFSNVQVHGSIVVWAGSHVMIR